ncbi:hypothetical protein [Mucilaginibacter segetis]|nr:hypothetical protein [Mucilaginibacter segetis]
MSKDKKMVKDKKKAPSLNVNKQISSYQSGKTSASTDLSPAKKSK